MGEDLQFNWLLKLSKKDLEFLTKGSINSFEKDGKRVYPTDKLVFLVDEDFSPKGVIKIKEFSIKDKSTYGKYEVLYILEGKEKEVLSSLFRQMYLYSDF